MPSLDIIVEKSDQFLQAFDQFGGFVDVRETTKDAVVCSMYGKPNLAKVDDVH